MVNGQGQSLKLFKLVRFVRYGLLLYGGLWGVILV